MTWREKYLFRLDFCVTFRMINTNMFFYLDHLYPASELLLQASGYGDLPPGLGAQDPAKVLLLLQ